MSGRNRSCSSYGVSEEGEEGGVFIQWYAKYTTSSAANSPVICPLTTSRISWATEWQAPNFMNATKMRCEQTLPSPSPPHGPRLSHTSI
ncbi:uncharacterized protein MYCFIDRAFT_169857 [Pseudocercospora fijiensis CIRAD86]|uniref:Uncharacterized protein n=1 Tax=Pseudocercospora fijiensis (strain CIRAD86) TaxID=383855 RepID=N1QAZ4_PSEFD|nr:uncharacterized protein MYCFIDRAFT_169857 [Pseudocercospora fijiensis CIRAD86]EME88193.1 hypothetical protein MYCFIDRAFT_169857 [Pseudocercospora fijiensis CIRAD86]